MSYRGFTGTLLARNVEKLYKQRWNGGTKSNAWLLDEEKFQRSDFSAYFYKLLKTWVV